jgi:hypothetical protein
MRKKGTTLAKILNGDPISRTLMTTAHLELWCEHEMQNTLPNAAKWIYMIMIRAEDGTMKRHPIKGDALALLFCRKIFKILEGLASAQSRSEFVLGLSNPYTAIPMIPIGRQCRQAYIHENPEKCITPGSFPSLPLDEAIRILQTMCNKYKVKYSDMDDRTELCHLLKDHFFPPPTNFC